MTATRTVRSPRYRRKRERWAMAAVVVLAAVCGLLAAFLASPQAWQEPGAGTTNQPTIQGSP
jgi:hypothetical protein